MKNGRSSHMNFNPPTPNKGELILLKVHLLSEAEEWDLGGRLQ